jgi:type IV secretory pathway VirB2 component (pilin)
MKKIVPVFLGLFLLMVPLVVFAQQYPDPVETICNILNIIKTIVLAIGLGIAVIILIIGGIQYMTAGGDAEKANNAKRMIINGIIGIAIVFAAAFILALVQGLLVGGGVSIFTNPCTF